MPAETVSDNVETLINLALAEDFGSGDVTSTYFVPEHLTARAKIGRASCRERV